MYKVNGEVFSCDITDSGRDSSREGDIQWFSLQIGAHARNYSIALPQGKAVQR